MLRNYIKKNYGCLGNNLEKTYGSFKQKSSVQLNFYRSYIVSTVLEPAENNFCNLKILKNHMIEISIEIIFFFQVLIETLFYEGLSEKSVLLKN